MATIETLIQRGSLIRIDVDLDGPEQVFRRLLALPRFGPLMETRLPTFVSSTGAEMTPLEQVDVLFHDFVVGKPLNHGRQFRRITPGKPPGMHGIWELKTIDMRIFGWFAAKACFIAVSGDLADNVKDSHLYAGYRNEAVRFRDQLDLDAPKFVRGGEYDVL